MKCEEALDLACDAEDLERYTEHHAPQDLVSTGPAGELSFGRRSMMALHILFCRRCAARLDRYARARSFLSGIFPPSPDFCDTVMDRIYHEEETGDYADGQSFEQAGGFSTRGWVIAGLVMLVSLATLFFGNDFASIALAQGSSFLLPLGIFIGVAITCYGALFIGSHLKELSERFKL